MYRQIRAMTDDLREETIRITQQLIRIPSFSMHEGKMADRVQNLLEEMNYDLVFRDAAGNVIGIMVGGDDGPTVLLSSHMDTVRPEGTWSVSPFSGERRDGHVFGLGAADCKGGLAAQIMAGHVLDQSRLPLRGNLIIASTVAEENGCSAGIQHLLEQTLPKLGFEPDLAVLGEPTSLTLCNGHDGWVDVDVNIEGRHEAVVRRASRLVYRYLKNLDLEFAARGDRDMILVDEPAYVEVGNTIEATLRIRHRIRMSETADDCVARVQHKVISALKILHRVPFGVHIHKERQKMYTGLAADISYRTDPWTTQPLDPPVDKAHTALAAAGFGDVPIHKCELDRLGMGTAGSKLVGNYKIPTVCFGPGDETSAHAANEHVDVEKIIEAVYGTAVLAHSVIGIPLFGWMAD